jgi:hypothetical protein
MTSCIWETQLLASTVLCYAEQYFASVKLVHATARYRPIKALRGAAVNDIAEEPRIRLTERHAMIPSDLAAALVCIVAIGNACTCINCERTIDWLIH